MKSLLTLIAAGAFVSVAAVPASAQYYDRPPGYYPRPDYGPEYYRHHRFGHRCEAVLRTPYGPQQLYCRIVDPKPLGAECACPTPPGYPRRYVPGQTIR